MYAVQDPHVSPMYYLKPKVKSGLEDAFFFFFFTQEAGNFKLKIDFASCVAWQPNYIHGGRLTLCGITSYFNKYLQVLFL